MNHFMERSNEIALWLIECRRYIHAHPETGNDLPNTTAYVKKVLTDMGCKTEQIDGGGLICRIGAPEGKTILLRADMDALPMEENSGLAFSSKVPGVAHCCGHDIHTGFLLGTAKLLKEREKELPGCVKLVFQTGEETLEGAKAMIDGGVLKNPSVDRAIGIHVQPTLPLNHLNFAKGAFLSSSDDFEIHITGKGSHGGQPHLGIDPIQIAAHLILVLHTLQVKEVPANAPVVLNICQIYSGSASNIVPDTAVLIGTLRTYDNTLREHLKKRLITLAASTAAMFGAAANVTYTSSCPCAVNNPAFTEHLSDFVSTLGVDFISDPAYRMQVSDDFALYSERVPSVMFIIGCKGDKENSSNNHNSLVQYNEKVLPLGAALLAHCAYCWLKDETTV